MYFGRKKYWRSEKQSYIKGILDNTCCPLSEPLDAVKKVLSKFAGPVLLSGFLTKGYFPRVSRQSCLSANDEYDNEMIPGVVQRSVICFTAEETPGKPQLGDRR